ncbi:MAG: RIP metalloprotease RseP [Thiomonas sp. 20-64-9]|jgi:regulator of sigma E protease|uniref:RIP metalloprotease RseP n=1 Tax=unclassified Thiomonas TaxID=2625466 RepID=UPI000B22FB19|nr:MULTISPECIES: RIP metalloprotease RseP [unclassified Thiomonas]OYV30611.1 MAG: RIP metalloprotease RseP [Thiomonas sp. 20-64-9]OZB71067.1 MAG: RIP metalloprotease RseP [Thiomonas sp. 13-64-67]
MNLLITLLAFAFALGVLITIHEFGHYRVAVACGVKVLRFSIGFGRPLLRWTRGADKTEFTLAWIPLGGYVKMLDEREGEVAEAELPRAFNRQSLSKRAAIVAAGPAANLLLATLLFAVVAFAGVREPVAILGAPPVHSPAAAAGVQGGERVLAVVHDGSQEAVQSWTGLRWTLLNAAMNGDRLALVVERKTDSPTQQIALDFSSSMRAAESTGFLTSYGLHLQSPPAEIREVVAGGPAQRSGLLAGDRIVAVDGKPIVSADALMRSIQTSGGKPMQLEVRRDGRTFQTQLQAKPVQVNGQSVWRIEAMLGGEIPTVKIERNPLQALQDGVQRTWDLSALTLKTLGRMVIGQASLQNLSGPVTIADYAGKSAELGWMAYLSFLAVVSVSLGVLNLLPLPILDGGHLLYYAYEGLTRRSVSQRWQERLQQGGLAVIAMMMAIALYNDLVRLLGQMH